MRRILSVVALCGLLSLTACDLLDRGDQEKSPAEQTVTTLRDAVPSGTVRTVLDLVLAGLALYGSVKGKGAESKAKAAAAVQVATEAREYNADEALSMAMKMRELGILPQAPKP